MMVFNELTEKEMVESNGGAKIGHEILITGGAIMMAVSAPVAAVTAVSATAVFSAGSTIATIGKLLDATERNRQNRRVVQGAW